MTNHMHIRGKHGGYFVRMTELRQAYNTMETALQDKGKGTQAYLQKYLGTSLPSNMDGYGNHFWVHDDTYRKLEMLNGPHGYAIAKMFLAKIT